jgi:hypothetical protein
MEEAGVRCEQWRRRLEVEGGWRRQGSKEAGVGAGARRGRQCVAAGSGSEWGQGRVSGLMCA